MNLPRVVIAGTSSGVGKTSVSCAVIRALADRGYTVQPFKAGPDYIDPGYLGAAAGRQTRNLDVWLMGRASIPRILARSVSDVAVIEGVMGLYDGLDGIDDTSSTFQVARLTRTPIILVVDARGAGRSLAATVLGFVRFGARSMIGGVILNRTGSARHAAICREAIESAGVRVLGAIPRDMPSLESRHLGLVPVREDDSIRDRIGALSDSMMGHIDMDGILDIARRAPPLREYRQPASRGHRATIGVALDGSFNFYYADTLEMLRREGADIVFFSPEDDGRLPDVDGLYIGGGFPEIRGAILERNRTMIRDIREMVQAGAPVYAECGGLMYLSRFLERDGRRFRMAGLYDADVRMTGRVVLNYTSGVMGRGPIAGGNTGFHGHEFHYSQMHNLPSDAVFAQSLDRGVGIADMKDGLLAYGAMASYGHLYLTQRAARSMVGRCATFSRK